MTALDKHINFLRNDLRNQTNQIQQQNDQVGQWQSEAALANGRLVSQFSKSLSNFLIETDKFHQATKDKKAIKFYREHIEKTREKDYKILTEEEKKLLAKQTQKEANIKATEEQGQQFSNETTKGIIAAQQSGKPYNKDLQYLLKEADPSLHSRLIKLWLRNKSGEYKPWLQQQFNGKGEFSGLEFQLAEGGATMTIGEIRNNPILQKAVSSQLRDLWMEKLNVGPGSSIDQDWLDSTGFTDHLLVQEGGVVIESSHRFYFEKSKERILLNEQAIFKAFETGASTEEISGLIDTFWLELKASPKDTKGSLYTNEEVHTEFQTLLSNLQKVGLLGEIKYKRLMNMPSDILDINNPAHTVIDKSGDGVPGEPGKKRTKSWAEMWPLRYGKYGTVSNENIKQVEQTGIQVGRQLEAAEVQADTDAYNFLIENEAMTIEDVKEEKRRLIGEGFHVHPKLDQLLEIAEKSPVTIKAETEAIIADIKAGRDITDKIPTLSPVTRNHPIVKEKLDAIAKWGETDTYKEMEKSVKHSIETLIELRPDKLRATTLSAKEKEAIHKATAYAQKMLAQGTVKTAKEAQILRKELGEDITPTDAALLTDAWVRENKDKGGLFEREKINGVRDFHNIRSSDYNFSSFEGPIILPNTFINSLPQQPDQVQSLLKNEDKLNKLIAENEELGKNWNEYFGKDANLNTAIPEKAFILSKQANIPIAEVLEKLNIHNGHGKLNPKLKDALFGEIGRVLHPKLLTALIQGDATASEANQIKARYWFQSPEGLIEKSFRGPLGDEVKYVNTDTGHEYKTPIIISLLGMLSEELGEDVSSDLQPGGITMMIDRLLNPENPEYEGMDYAPEVTRKQKIIDLLRNPFFLKYYSQFDPRANVLLDTETPEDLRRLTGQGDLETEWVEALQLT